MRSPDNVHPADA